MSRIELRAGVALAAIFALRMLGLFLVLPVFVVSARTISGGDDLTLVGLTLGAYGLTQAIFQIPFGMASDRFGRKRVIYVGLGLFMVGSVIAACATNLEWMLVGRVVQGAGAISSAVTALAADLTREQHRTKVMAMIGSSIGLVFAISLVIAPPIVAFAGLSGIFWLTAALAAAAIFVLLVVVPEAPDFTAAPRVSVWTVLNDPRLMQLNFGIFCLHLTQMAMFVVLPQLLVRTGALPLQEHWKVYLPAVLVSFLVMVPAIIAGERKGRGHLVFTGAVALLLVAQLNFVLSVDSFHGLALGLLVFFVAFNILEASLPSLVSRIAPAQAKGMALGVYNTLQAVGLFAGGFLGGWLSKQAGPVAVFAGMALIVGAWLLVALRMPAWRARIMVNGTP